MKAANTDNFFEEHDLEGKKKNKKNRPIAKEGLGTSLVAQSLRIHL